ncbi:diguanylate cyclase domain-containing protein [Alicyclobacillus fodiniaquatilis]|uniref:Diguanylate cyclase domain-containing protein n=1 Tax=Alicyclobacillus fodiniaquatilis TaxID=1661150 RepID=A0ABW4JJW8_9BACL
MPKNEVLKLEPEITPYTLQGGSMRKINIVLAGLLIMFIMVILLIQNLELKTLHIQEQSMAHQGVIDLRDNATSTPQIISLTGQWLFYPKELISPEDIKHKVGPERETIDVPKVWGQGYGTYELTITLPTNEQHQLNAIYIPSISSSYRMWINGITMHTAGVVGLTRTTTTPQDSPGIVVVPKEQGNSIHIVIQVSNFIQQKGGIGEVPYLGSIQSLNRLESIRLSEQLFIIGSLFTLSVFCLSLYLSNRRDKFPLYFALFCIDVIVQALFLNDTTITTFFPTVGWSFETRVQYLSASVGVFLLLLTTRALYPKDSIRKIESLFFVFSSVLSIMFMTTPPWIFTYTLLFMSVIAITVNLYMLFVFSRAIVNHRSFALLNMVSLLVLTGSIVNDLLYYTNAIQSQELLPVGLFFYVLIQTIIYSVTHTRNLLNLDIKAEQLLALNQELEKKVHDRTIELSRAVEELNKLAMRDDLTSIPNRRFFETAIYDSMEFLLNKGNIGLMLIDVDYFKQYNDLYGHLSGDECLRKIALTLDNEVRRNKDSFVARIGGEEFVAVFSEVKDRNISIIADDLLNVIKELNIPHPKSSVSPTVTISIGGVVSFVTPELNHEDLLRHADEMLYKAKERGRNQFTLTTMSLNNHNTIVLDNSS